MSGGSWDHLRGASVLPCPPAAAWGPAEHKGGIMGSAITAVVGLAIVGMVLFGLFVILRGFSLWYWRVDEALALMERQAKAAERTAGAVEELLDRTRPGRE